MNFKEWLKIDEARLKGFQKHFLRTHPHIPPYVAHQIYTNRLGPELSKSIKNYKIIAPTVIQSKFNPDPEKTVDFVPTAISPMLSPNDLLNNEILKNVIWDKKPKMVELCPLDFEEGTLNLFLQWRFGFSPKDHLVRNDSNRFDIQKQKLIDRIENDNEPIVLIKIGNKYKLLEGYHRTMTYLLWPHQETPGAPLSQIAMLEKGEDPRKLDLTKWLRVPIKAYIGTKSELAA